MGMSDDIFKELQDIVSRETSKVVRNTTIEVKDNTPVDTGWAMANWIPSIGEPFDNLVSPGSKEVVRSGGKISESEYRSAMQDIEKYKLEQGNLLYIRNNVDYVPILNEGSSTQAPAGFVQIAIDQAIQKTGRE